MQKLARIITYFQLNIIDYFILKLFRKRWEDFEKYPWTSPDKIDIWQYDYAAQKVPEGMGVFVCPASGFLEIPKLA